MTQRCSFLFCVCAVCPVSLPQHHSMALSVQVTQTYGEDCVELREHIRLQNHHLGEVHSGGREPGAVLAHGREITRCQATLPPNVTKDLLKVFDQVLRSSQVFNSTMYMMCMPECHNYIPSAHGPKLRCANTFGARSQLGEQLWCTARADRSDKFVRWCSCCGFRMERFRPAAWQKRPCRWAFAP
eukprot:SAG11_NODE_1518_length_4761_cov_2.905405_8_plen_185_part_00